MPRILIAKYSGVHRTACFALYRALLRQKQRLPVADQWAQLYEKYVKTTTRKNARLQSYRHVIPALHLGYETIEALQSEEGTRSILKRIAEMRATSDRTAAANVGARDVPKKPAPRPRVWPHPATKPLLERPRLSLSGRRHAPILANANRVPILRIGKPQPPYLSRIIRNTINTREYRIKRIWRLDHEIKIAEAEDGWDSILAENFDLHQEVDGRPWCEEPKRARADVRQLQEKTLRNRVALAIKMHVIVEEEKVLVRAEKTRLRDEKRKLKIARRLARRGILQVQQSQEKFAIIPEENESQAIEDNARDILSRDGRVFVKPDRDTVLELRLGRKEEKAMTQNEKARPRARRKMPLPEESEDGFAGISEGVISQPAEEKDSRIHMGFKRVTVVEEIFAREDQRASIRKEKAEKLVTRAALPLQEPQDKTMSMVEEKKELAEDKPSTVISREGRVFVKPNRATVLAKRANRKEEKAKHQEEKARRKGEDTRRHTKNVVANYLHWSPQQSSRRNAG